MKRILQNVIATTAITVLLAPSPAAAQQNSWTGGATGDWSDATWAFGVPSGGIGIDSEALVGSTVGSGTPTAAVDVTNSQDTPAVTIGGGAGTDGTVNVTGTGTLNVVDTPPSNGNLVVGEFDGLGTLNVDSGTLVIAGGLLNSSGAAASAINLTGSASVTAASAFFDRNLTIDESNVSLSIGGDATFGLSGTHTWVIPTAGASAVSVGGNADLGGTLKVEFPDGKPVVGSTFNLIDAATVDNNEVIPSGFSFVDTSSVSGLGPGERFSTQTVAGGTNGQLAQLVLEQQPVLIVDRDTGSVTVQNPGGVASIDIDTYAITSPTLGALVPGNWNSFEDQGAAGGAWLEANPTANAISELNPSSSGAIPANTDVVLGNIFNLVAPSTFGEENEDLVFRYSKPDGGFINGDIEYTGLANNTLTLEVDPSTGEAQLTNGTSFTVSIDAYVIDSASGSLEASNGDWSSLEDQGVDGGNWFEADADADRISELLVTGGLELAPNDVVNLGFLFDEVDGIQDLDFRFAILPSDASPGDFNADGVVDGADYAVWRNNLNAPDDSSLNNNGDGVAGISAADLQVWRDNFGATGSSGGDEDPALLTGKVLYTTIGLGAAAASSTPEPASAALVLTMVSLIGVGGRRRS
ncbi:MAG: hypothetical protein AAF589_01195 [Planctomycetota bacterium]